VETPPKVFISHASEDKERFVLRFAERLRARGVDAWLDRWEMLPGDSLVDKIFEEGIKNAQAMIVVLSSASVNKRWVREELNAGMVKRISNSTKLIPVLIDQCEVPEALQSTVWERIPNLDSYDAEFERILAAIFSVTAKPPIGPPPAYARVQLPLIGHLNRTDTLVLKSASEKSIQKGVDWISLQDISSDLAALDISTDQVHDAIEVLDEALLIEAQHQIGGPPDFFRITPHGFETFAEAFMPDFSSIVDRTLLAIVNRELLTNDAIAAHLEKPKVVIDYALDTLANRGFIKVTKTMGGGAHVHEITVRGRRAASEIDQ
jgi:hypothetical protein